MAEPQRPAGCPIKDPVRVKIEHKSSNMVVKENTQDSLNKGKEPQESANIAKPSLTMTQSYLPMRLFQEVGEEEDNENGVKKRGDSSDEEDKDEDNEENNDRAESWINQCTESKREFEGTENIQDPSDEDGDDEDKNRED